MVLAEGHWQGRYQYISDESSSVEIFGAFRNLEILYIISDVLVLFALGVI